MVNATRNVNQGSFEFLPDSVELGLPSTNASLSRHRGEVSRTSVTDPTRRIPGLEHEGTGIVRSLNIESSTRLMLAGLEELVEPLQLMRRMAANIDRISQQISLVDVDSLFCDLHLSVAQLSTVVQELECRADSMSNRFWNSLEPGASILPFASFPDRSLLSRARYSRASPVPVNDMRARGDRITIGGTLEQRLTHVATELQGLVRRLDNLAQNTRSMRNHRSAFSERIRLIRQAASNPHTEDVFHESLQELEISPRMAHFQTYPSERTEASTRSFPQVVDNGSQGETSHESRFSRNKARNALTCFGTSGDSGQLFVVQQVTSHGERQKPLLSSHVPIIQEAEKLFCDGIEYRNCMGLWLSKTGAPAPEHAFNQPFQNLGIKPATDS